MKNIVLVLLLLMPHFTFANTPSDGEQCSVPVVVKNTCDNPSPTFALAGELFISQAAFTLINAVLYREQIRERTAGVGAILAISSIEVAKNLVNFLNIEINSQILGPVIGYAAFNSLRANLPPQPNANAWWMYFEFALAEVVKNRVNFQITENLYPRVWLPASFNGTSV